MSRTFQDHMSCVTVDTHVETSESEVGMAVGSKEKLWSVVEQLYQTGLFPGLSFCLRHQNRVVINRSVGYLSHYTEHDIGTKPAKMTPDTPLCLFSASKMVVAMAVHYLVGERLLELEREVGYYLGDFKHADVGRLLLRDLLTHRAGIPSLSEFDSTHIIFDTPAVLSKIGQMTPQKGKYKSPAYHAVTAGFLLGALCEKVSGQSLRSLIDQAFCKPMGMKYFNYGLAELQQSLCAVNYVTGPTPPKLVHFWLSRILGTGIDDVVALSNHDRFLKSVVPAVNLFATPEEICRFLQMVSDRGYYEGRQIIKPNCVEDALVPVSKFEIDKMFLLPVRYSAGFMLGANPVGLWGPFSEHAFGHIGFTTKMCWGNTKTNTMVALLMTGNPILGAHLKILPRLLAEISRYCR